MTVPGPPRWAERLLCAFLGERDGESISGDLLEEYREAVRPARGWMRADLWYVRQATGIFWHLLPSRRDPMLPDRALGFALGAAFATVIVSINVVCPALGLVIPENEAARAAGWGAVFGVFALCGFLGGRRTGRTAAGARSGATVASVSFALAMLTFVAVDNVFLGIVSRQPEKIWLFEHSGHATMRAYVNAARALLTVLPVLTACGAVLGAVGSLLGRITRRSGTAS